jgi:hypothetical protein
MDDDSNHGLINAHLSSHACLYKLLISAMEHTSYSATVRYEGPQESEDVTPMNENIDNSRKSRK